MNNCDSSSKHKEMMNDSIVEQQPQTNITCKMRKKREELSVLETNSIKKRWKL